MLYFANPVTPKVREAMTDGPLCTIVTPSQGNKLPDSSVFIIDNGCGPTKNGEPGANYPGDEAYLDYLGRLFDDAMPEFCDPDSYRCLFAVVPDVLGDAAATLKRFGQMAGWMRHLGYPVALVAQNGLEDLEVPWDEFDCLFLGGDTDWKLGPAARRLTAEAKARGKWVHMGRVNSLRRLRYADAIGCDSADGTYLVFGPDENLPKLVAWVRDVNCQGDLFGNAA